PQWLGTVAQRSLPLKNAIFRFCRACPPQLRDFLLSTLESFSQETGALLGKLSESFLAFCASLIRSLPDYLLFFITTVLAVFYTSACFPSIRSFLLRQLSFRLQKLAKEVKPQLFSTALKWLKAELTLIAITFFLLLSGFLLLRLQYALLLALVISLLDALPILGIGTVLLPWAFFALATENFLLGISLIALYLTVQLTHSLLEPRLIAAQGGLPSIAALFAMYVGFRVLGLLGMIFCPLLLLLAKCLHDEGYLRLWK
ncbi:MAG: AI-2E family transporter, partial [Oscillospiraceae bacterium]|nr:AI-2E family transporter [Oscillospiraceae bacterium]